MELEYISYEEYPSDQYTKAVFTLLKDKQDLLTFGLKEAKTGGQFWATPSISVADGQGGKKYFQAWEHDSKAVNSKIISFIEETVKQLKGGKAPIAQSANVFASAELKEFPKSEIEQTLPF